jgi:hypothetical protein
MASCELSPASPLVPGQTSERVRGVSLTLEADPATAAPGETVHLTATAHNSTDELIQIGVLCGPAMDVLITTPGGERRSALWDLLGPDAAFTCELGPHHFVEPKSTRVARIEWVAGWSEGDYVAIAGLRREKGLGNLSAPVVIRVR